MTPEQIQAFIDAMARSDLAELEVHHEGWRLRLSRGQPTDAVPRGERGAEAPADFAAAAADGADAAGGPRPAAALLPAAAAVPAPAAPPSAATPHEVLAPLYGVVHLQPAPGAEPFVRPGQAVAIGQLLCSIEAMKVFNEVRAEAAGTLQALLVSSGTEVEAGQALMRIAPSTDV